MPSEPRPVNATVVPSSAYDEYVRNLRNWEATIKMKDAQLRSLKSKLQPATEPTPVKRPTSSNDNDEPSSGDAPQGDPDSMIALQTLIDEENSSESTGSDDEEFQAEWKRQRALIEKEKGNRLFKDGRYDEAIESYGIGIECDPQNPVLYANRAMAFLRKNMLGVAEEDCNQALRWDPNYVKAYHRRGLAREGLGKKALALEDFRTVLSLEPNNREARQHLTKLEKELKSESGQTGSKEPSSTASAPLVQVEKSTKGSSVVKRTTPPAAAAAATAVTAVRVEPLNAPRNRKASKKPLRRVPIVDIAGGTPLKEEWVPTGRVQQPELPPPPTTSYQFQVDWRQLAPFPELRYKYLKQLDASKIGAFFREAMESELFCEILCILENQFLRDGVDIYPVLSNLPKVGRFSTLVMLLGGEDRKRLARLLAVTSKADPGLAESYGL